MARLFGDGFDHYGTDESNMLDGVYALASGTLSTSIVATGTHSFRLTEANSGSGTFNGLRKVLPASLDKMGVMLRVYYPLLPGNNNDSILCSFFSNTTSYSQVSAYLGANGELAFYRGSQFNFANFGERTFITQTDPIISSGAFNHIEIQIYFHNTLGWIRVAVNNDEVFEETGLDTSYDSVAIGSVGHHNFTSAGGESWNPYIDDYVLYDFTGTAATDTDWCPAVDGSGVATEFIGDLQGMWQTPTADTAEDDWQLSTGTDSFALVDEVDPNDVDYIFSDTVDDLTEFEMSDLPSEITYIRGVDLWGRLSKSDGGIARVSMGVKSVAAITDAADRSISVAPTYYWDQVNTDPNTTARWTRAGLNAAWFRIKRTV